MACKRLCHCRYGLYLCRWLIYVNIIISKWYICVDCLISIHQKCVMVNCPLGQPTSINSTGSPDFERRGSDLATPSSHCIPRFFPISLAPVISLDSQTNPNNYISLVYSNYTLAISHCTTIFVGKITFLMVNIPYIPNTSMKHELNKSQSTFHEILINKNSSFH